MPSVSLVSPSAAIRADAVVIGVRGGPEGLTLAAGAHAIDNALGGRLIGALTTLGATGRADEVTKIPTHGLADFPLVVATGIGEQADEDEALRRACGAAARALAGTRRVHIAIDGPLGPIAEGFLLGSYTFDGYKSTQSGPSTRSVSIATRHAIRAELRRARTVAAAVTLARDLVNTPPNDLYPETFAQRAVDAAQQAGIAVEVLDPRALRRGAFGGLLAVGGGSAHGPRLVRMSYAPGKARTHLALVGKGITFDSGGLNLKTAHLTWMKSDMAGAAAVIASMVAIAALKLPIRVTATLPMAENMPSGSAYRPSDVLTLRGGRTVEVADTGAEGRLVLADAITRAVEDEPDQLIEISTMTDAQLTALGPRLIGAMGEPAMRDRVIAAANDVGESAWAMPIPDELRAVLDSTVADIANLGTERWAGMLVGARFLAEFIPDGLPWVHLDIFGPAWNTAGARDYTPKGGTGAGVRTIIAAVEQLSAD